MAASNYLNNAQLQMFMPAKKLYNQVPSIDADLEPLAKNDEIADMKRSENQKDENDMWENAPGYPKLKESIKKEGIKAPVQLAIGSRILKPLLADGNHRVVAAHDIDPNMEVPVTYRRDYEMTGGMSFPREFYVRTKAEEKADEQYFAPKKRMKK